MTQSVNGVIITEMQMAFGAAGFDVHLTLHPVGDQKSWEEMLRDLDEAFRERKPILLKVGPAQ